MSEAIAGGLFHPNCKDTIVTYFPGINSEVKPPTKAELAKKIENYKNDQKSKYIDRQIDKYSRLEEGSIDEDNIEKYHNKKVAWQNYKKKFEENNKNTFRKLIENEKVKQRESIKNEVIGNILNSTEIKDVSSHFIDRIMQREIELNDVINTLKNPLEYGKIKYDKENRPSFKTVGEKITIYVNPETGIITTVHKTHTKTAEKLKGKK